MNLYLGLAALAVSAIAFVASFVAVILQETPEERRRRVAEEVSKQIEMAKAVGRLR